MTESKESKESLDQQKAALDDAFYRDDEESTLVEQLRLRLREEAAKEELAEASGIRDEEILARLAGLGIRADTLAALTLIPLLQVAWADNVMEEKEKHAVLAGAASTGIRSGSASHELLKIWLDDRPPPDLVKAWAAFISGLSAELSSVEVDRLRENILVRARNVAEAAGNLLRDSSMISAEEESVLRELEQSFG